MTFPGQQQAIRAEGHNGQIEFDGYTVTIFRKGFRAKTTIGGGEKRLPIQSITAVQFKPAGMMTNGYVEFTIAGGVEMRSRAGSATVNAATNENAVLFTRKQQPDFERLRQAMEQAQAAAQRGYQPAVAPPSVSDELAKLGQMYQQGLLSPEEFAQAKRRLIG